MNTQRIRKQRLADTCCSLIRRVLRGYLSRSVFLVCSGALVFGAAQGYAQDQLLKPPPRTVPDNLPVRSVLYELRDLLPVAEKSVPKRQQIQRFAARGITLRDDGKVLVEIIGPEGVDIRQDLDLSALEVLGAEIGVKAVAVDAKQVHVPLTSFGNRAEAWLPLQRLVEIAALLPDGYFIKEITPLNTEQVAGEGPMVTNSASYRNAGQDGAGLTIAVIDMGFSNLTAAQTNGDAPTTYAEINYANGEFESGGPHGTGCVEAAFDHAPGATWRLYRVDSLADLGPAVNDAIASNVDVISHSLSWMNLGWDDDTGPACDAANHASDNGIVFFTAAGNQAQSHYQGDFADSDNDGWHEFAAGDEAIDLTIGPDEGGNYYLSWSNPDTDLDFYLYDDSTPSTVVAKSDNGGGAFEEFYLAHLNPTPLNFHLAVLHRSGPESTEIEIFSHSAGTWTEHTVAASSTHSPSNSTGSLVIAVGAVTHTLYGQPNGSNVIAGFSSRGPSNSGMALPDLCGPTHTQGLTYPGGFGGTSCATANAAGAACAFWSADTQLGGYAILWLLKEQADLWRDWGTAGNDNTYGKGGVLLTDYHFGTRWVARSYPGTADLPTAPYYTVQGAHAVAPNNGRLLIFGDDYGTYPGSALLGGKRFVVEEVSGSGPAILGE